MQPKLLNLPPAYRGVIYSTMLLLEGHTSEPVVTARLLHGPGREPLRAIIQPEPLIVTPAVGNPANWRATLRLEKTGPLPARTWVEVTVNDRLAYVGYIPVN